MLRSERARLRGIGVYRIEDSKAMTDLEDLCIRSSEPHFVLDLTAEAVPSSKIIRRNLFLFASI